MRARVQAIFRAMKKPVSVVALSNSTEPHIDLSFFYATGLTDGLFEGCSAFLRRDGRSLVLSSALEEESARKGRDPVRVFRRRDQRQDLMRKALAGARTVGVNASEITHRAFSELRRLAPRRAKFVDVSEAITRARMVKDEGEVRLIRRACVIASEAFEEVAPEIRAGTRESEVAADLVRAMQRRGASGPSFRTIVGSGPNGAEPHYTAGSRKLRRGDLVVIDFGAAYRMYVSDITRTIAVGRASARQKEIHETVRHAQDAATAALREGRIGKEVDTAARSVIDASPWKGRFIHGLGHTIGLAVHDGGGLNQASDVVLRRGMVFTNEPGIYVRGYGGVRIEDDLVVTGGRPRLLTTATRELLEV